MADDMDRDPAAPRKAESVLRCETHRELKRILCHGCVWDAALQFAALPPRSDSVGVEVPSAWHGRPYDTADTPAPEPASAREATWIGVALAWIKNHASHAPGCYSLRNFERECDCGLWDLRKLIELRDAARAALEPASARERKLALALLDVLDLFTPDGFAKPHYINNRLERLASARAALEPERGEG